MRIFRDTATAAFFFDGFEVTLECFQLGEFRLQFASPEFMEFTIGQWFTVFYEEFSTGVPCLGTTADFDSLVGKDGTNGAFAAVDAIDDGLSVFDESSSCSHFFAWNVSGNQLVNGGQSSQFESVVFVRFSFDISEHPSFFVGATDENLDFQFLAKIADPATGSARLDDHQIGAEIGKDTPEIASLGGDGFQPVCLGR